MKLGNIVRNIREHFMRQDRKMKSRGYFPNTKQGQREYEKQWEGDKQFGPIVVPTVGLPFLDENKVTI